MLILFNTVQLYDNVIYLHKLNYWKEDVVMNNLLDHFAYIYRRTNMINTYYIFLPMSWLNLYFFKVTIKTFNKITASVCINKTCWKSLSLKYRNLRIIFIFWYFAMIVLFCTIFCGLNWSHREHLKQIKL